jgi:nitrate reductase gamma subunit
MEQLLEFAKGPLFRLTFAIMVLGLARILILDLVEIVRSYRRAGDKTLPWGKVISRSLEWLVPVRLVFKRRPVYSLFSILFHIGLLLVPIFLYAHVQLWRGDLGFAIPTLPYGWAYGLTVLTIFSAVALIIGRLANRTSSFLSRKQDFLWPVVLLIPFVTGFVCAHMGVSPGGYRLFMLMHVLSAELIFVLIPFTKIAHCVIMPLSQIVANVAWKFPPDTDDKVCTTLNKKGAPV